MTDQIRFFRIDFLREGDRRLAYLVEDVQYLASGEVCELFHDTDMNAGHYLACLSISSEMSESSDYRHMMANVLGKISKVRSAVQIAIKEALTNEQLCENYDNWERTTLSDFSLTCEVKPDLTIDEASFSLKMKYPLVAQTSELPFQGADHLQESLIQWIKESGGITSN